MRKHIVRKSGVVASNQTVFVEMLEVRRLFAVNVGQQNGIIDVTGTANDDTVEVVMATNAANQNVFRVRDLATGRTWDYFGATAIVMDGGDGGDTFTVSDEISIRAQLKGGAGGDSLRGGSGNDLIQGGAGDDPDLDGGDGNDEIYGGDGGDFGWGGKGNDTIEGGSGLDHLHGNDGDDTIRGNEDGDLLNGHAGKDTLEGGDGDDELEGGDGDDILNLGAGSDTALGGLGDDTFSDVADGFEDWAVDGGDGSDTLVGGWDNTFDNATGLGFYDSIANVENGMD